MLSLDAVSHFLCLLVHEAPCSFVVWYNSILSDNLRFKELHRGLQMKH